MSEPQEQQLIEPTQEEIEKAQATAKYVLDTLQSDTERGVFLSMPEIATMFTTFFGGIIQGLIDNAVLADRQRNLQQLTAAVAQQEQVSKLILPGVKRGPILDKTTVKAMLSALTGIFQRNRPPQLQLSVIQTETQGEPQSNISEQSEVEVDRQR